MVEPNSRRSTWTVEGKVIDCAYHQLIYSYRCASISVKDTQMLVLDITGLCPCTASLHAHKESGILTVCYGLVLARQQTYDYHFGLLMLAHFSVVRAIRCASQQVFKLV